MIAAATIDHGLRPESRGEAEFVARLCDERGIPHAILSAEDLPGVRGNPDPREAIAGNIQSKARKLRYALLEHWRTDQRLGWVATAHHGDDQFETLVMRLMRGSGVDGLAAIRPLNGKIIRPLLGTRKAELEAIVVAEGIDPVRDPSNADDAYDRARLRKALAAIPELDPARIARSAEALREASEALDWVVEREWQARSRCEDFETYHIEMTGLPSELVRRLAVRAIEAVRFSLGASGNWRQDKLAGVLKTVRSDGRATIADVLIEGGESWRFSAAPPRKTG